MSKIPVISTLVLLCSFAITKPAFADGDLQNVQHIVIVMQENHSFDNYFGVLPHAPGSPYHRGNGACSSTDHTCVDGLQCTFNGSGVLTCTNSNLDDNGSTVSAFHSPTRCVAPTSTIPGLVPTTRPISRAPTALYQVRSAMASFGRTI